MSATDVIRLRADLSDRFIADGALPAILVSHLMGTSEYNLEQEQAGAAIQEMVHAVCAQEGRDAANYYIEPELMPVIADHVAHLGALDGTPELGTMDAFAGGVDAEHGALGNGFCWLADPLGVPNAVGKVARIDLITWARARLVGPEPDAEGNERTGVIVAFWAHAHRDAAEGLDESAAMLERSLDGVDERTVARVRRALGPWRFTAVAVMQTDDTPGPAFAVITDRYRAQLAELGSEVTNEHTLNLRCWLSATWGVLSRVLPGCVSQSQPAEARSAVKSARRRGHPQAVSIVRIGAVAPERPTHSGERTGTGTPLRYQRPTRAHTRTLYAGTDRERTIEVRKSIHGEHLPPRPVERPQVRVAGHRVARRRTDG